MAEIHEIDVQIDPMGNVSVEVRGVSGKRCEEITAALEQALGGAVVGRRYTEAYYRKDTTQAETSRAYIRS